MNLQEEIEKEAKPKKNCFYTIYIEDKKTMNTSIIRLEKQSVSYHFFNQESQKYVHIKAASCKWAPSFLKKGTCDNQQ